MASRTTRFQRRARRTLRIALAWAVAGSLAALLERNILDDQGLSVSLRDLLDKYVWRLLLAGLLGGGLYVFVLRDHLRRLPFIHAFPIMAALVFITVLVTHAVLPSWSDGPGGAHFADRVVSLRFLGQFLFWTLMMGSTMLMVRYNDQYGSGGISYLMGRYHEPREELRIFMFLDMRSSTAIAEELGHVKYFQLLNQVYADITDPVVDSGGNIYQYVGDEVSVSWPLSKGLKDQRCLRCFFAIRDKIQSRAAVYRRRFGQVPVFKAGLHYGPVTAGEVGLVKKEVIFSGDPVITAAHIQSACNGLGVDILLSEELLQQLRPPENRYVSRYVTEIPLKSRKRSVRLWTIRRAADAPTAGEGNVPAAATSSEAVRG